MSNATVTYGNASFPQANSIATVTALSTSETDIFVVKDMKDMEKSQTTIYGSVTLGAVASATFYYYVSPDNGTTWHPISLYNTSTGEVTQRAVLVDSGTYATGGVSLFADSVPMPATTAFKVTGKSATGTPAVSLKIMLRDN